MAFPVQNTTPFLNSQFPVLRNIESVSASSPSFSLKVVSNLRGVSESMVGLLKTILSVPSHFRSRFFGSSSAAALTDHRQTKRACTATAFGACQSHERH